MNTYAHIYVLVICNHILFYRTFFIDEECILKMHFFCFQLNKINKINLCAYLCLILIRYALVIYYTNYIGITLT